MSKRPKLSPAQQRQAVLWKHSGMSITEIAKTLGCSRNTVYAVDVDSHGGSRMRKTPLWEGWHVLKASRCLGREPYTPVEVGVPLHATGPLATHVNGMHATQDILFAMANTTGPWICRVHLLGKRIDDDDQSCARTRVVQWMVHADRVARLWAGMCLWRALDREVQDGRPPPPAWWQGLSMVLTYPGMPLVVTKYPDPPTRPQAAKYGRELDYILGTLPAPTADQVMRLRTLEYINRTVDAIRASDSPHYHHNDPAKLARLYTGLALRFTLGTVWAEVYMAQERSLPPKKPGSSSGWHRHPERPAPSDEDIRRAKIRKEEMEDARKKNAYAESVQFAVRAVHYAAESHGEDGAVALAAEEAWQRTLLERMLFAMHAAQPDA